LTEKTRQSIQTQAYLSSFFQVESVLDAVERLGFLQIDPMQAPARAQDMILRQRIKGYRVGDLEKAYPELPLDEDYLHVYGVMPSTLRELLHPRTRAWDVEEEFPELVQRVRAFIEENGETDFMRLEAYFKERKTRGNWGNGMKATTRVLEALHFQGHLRVKRRFVNRRVYVPAVPPASPLPADVRLRTLVNTIARLYAPIPASTLRTLVGNFRYSLPELDGRKQVIQEMLRSGELEQAEIDGVSYIWPAGEWMEGEIPPEVRILAPFDPLVCDRARFEHLWGWAFRLEAYTPAAARKFGHYALPVLWRGRAVGWANISANGGKLDVDLGFSDGRPADPRFEPALEEELARLSAAL